MAKWMDITIFGLNVAITWQPKTSQKNGTEFSEQRLSDFGTELNEKVNDLRRRIVRMQKRIEYFGVDSDTTPRPISKKREKVEPSLHDGGGSPKPRVSTEDTSAPTPPPTSAEILKAKLMARKK